MNSSKTTQQFGKYALSSVPPSQAGLPKGHVPFHTSDEFVSDYKIIVAGKNFGIKGNRFLQEPAKTPLSNLQLTLADKMGVKVDGFGDSTGEVAELLSL